MYLTQLGFILLAALMPISNGMTPVTDPISWMCDGPQPIDPNPHLVQLPSDTPAGSFFGINATLDNCTPSNTTGLFYTLRIASTDGSTLVVPPDSVFTATDESGARLAPGSFAPFMALIPLTSSGQTLASAYALTISLAGHAGASAGSATVYFGVGNDQAAISTTASSAILIH